LKDLQADINAAIKLEKKMKDKKFIDEIKTALILLVLFFSNIVFEKFWTIFKSVF